MSERGSFTTEFINCGRCYNAVRRVLLQDDKFLRGIQIPGWTGMRGDLPIIAGKIGGGYAGEELHTFIHELAPEIAKGICCPVRVAILADSGQSGIYRVLPLPKGETIAPLEMLVASNESFDIPLLGSAFMCPMPRRPSLTIYAASRTIHATKWRWLRAKGWRIISTWIDEAGEGQTASYGELAERCLTEAAVADVTLLYRHGPETLKGALLEAGAALAAGKLVIYLGDTQGMSRVFLQHKNWHTCTNLEAALMFCDGTVVLPQISTPKEI